MSFTELIAIKDAARKMAEEDRRAEAGKCPNDGDTLVYNEKRNESACPWGDYQRPGR